MGEKTYKFRGTRTTSSFSENTGRPLKPRQWSTTHLRPFRSITVRATSREEAVQKIREKITANLFDPVREARLRGGPAYTGKLPQHVISGSVQEIGLKPGRPPGYPAEILETFDYCDRNKV